METLYPRCRYCYRDCYHFLLAACLVMATSTTSAFQHLSYTRPSQFLHGNHPHRLPRPTGTCTVTIGSTLCATGSSSSSISRSTLTGNGSKAEQRFDAMLTKFRRHSAADINLVTSPRYRGLLSGTSTAINDEKVTTAFKVLYQDLGPVRVAGDLIFSKLESEMNKSKASDGAGNVRALGRGDSCVVAARMIFDAVDADASGTVSSMELLNSDLLRSLGQCVDCTCEKKGNCQSVAKFMDEIDKTHPEGELHFDEFLVAAHHLLYEGDASVSLFGGEDSSGDLVDQLLSGRGDGIGVGTATDLNLGKSERYSKRFDVMCHEFMSWDSNDSAANAEARNPRLALVLEGCFAGAKEKPVVDALKILYTDYLVLRMAGDLIFKMMRKLAR